jgi:nicotinamidase-related amidase
MRIEAAESAFVLVDVQERLCPHMANAELLRRRLEVLLKGLTLLNVPIIVTQQYTKGLGPTIPSLQECLPPDSRIPVEKLAFGCCDEAAFRERLGALGRHQVILAGIEAHVCVLQTVLGLRERSYGPVVVADAVSSRGELDRELALRRMEHEGAIITTTESLLFELTRAAGTDTFRAISRLVK